MSPRKSIRRRFQRVIILTTAAVLALACAVFILLEWRGSLKAERSSALSTARITADATSAMLAFKNRTEAERQLAAFRSEPDVLAAALYDTSGNVFAEYRGPGADRP